jgi:hypothetical protein
MFGDMIYGRAYKPYVYRFLLPNIVRFSVNIIPSDIRETITHSNLHILNWESELLPEYLIASILMCASLIGFGFAIRYLFKGVFQTTDILADVASLVALAGIPLHFKYYSFIYDFLTLFLFTLGLGLMVRRKWRIYLLLFALACLNKETTILLTLVFVIYFFKRWTMISQKQFFQLLAIQILIFVLTRIVISWIFVNNPGESFEFHLFDHNFALTEYPYILGANLLLALGVIALVFYRWAEKPTFLKNSLFIALPLLTGALLFGYLDEFRAYYEVYPVVFLLIFHTIGNILGIKLDSPPTPNRIFDSTEKISRTRSV